MNSTTRSHYDPKTWNPATMQRVVLAMHGKHKNEMKTHLQVPQQKGHSPLPQIESLQLRIRLGGARRRLQSTLGSSKATAPAEQSMMVRQKR